MSSYRIYLDILRHELYSPLEWFYLYVGSAVGNAVLFQRIKTYFRWIRGCADSTDHAAIHKAGGAHAEAMLDLNVNIQFVILAKFSRKNS